jgi:hypothetical protein
MLVPGNVPRRGKSRVGEESLGGDSTLVVTVVAGGHKRAGWLVGELAVDGAWSSR